MSPESRDGRPQCAERSTLWRAAAPAPGHSFALTPNTKAQSQEELSMRQTGISSEPPRVPVAQSGQAYSRAGRPATNWKVLRTSAPPHDEHWFHAAIDIP